jgi:hypothetical protein
MKTYPLEVFPSGSDEYAVASKGHHDVHEFMKVVRAEGYDWPLGMPTHQWWRSVPTLDEEWTCMYIVAKPGARGAFPVTVAEEASGSECYESVLAKQAKGE